MKKHSDGRYSMRLGLLAIGAIVAGSAIADEDLPTITITASRMGRSAVTTEVVGRAAATGAPVERLTLTWSVPFTDLDLSTHSGATELQKRVNARAQAVCQELDRLFPFTDRGGAPCVKEAAAGGLAQADKLIAAAEHARAQHSSK
jgi:UrcA family protein